MKKCPYCAEEIRDEAVLCRYCGRRVRKNPLAIAIIVILILGLFVYIATNRPRVEYAKYRMRIFFHNLSRAPELLGRFLDDVEQGLKAYKDYRKNISSGGELEAELQKHKGTLK